MALLGNHHMHNKCPGRNFAGGDFPFLRGAFSGSGANRNRFYGAEDKNWSEYNGQPQGYRPPATYIIPYKTGAISSKQMIFGTGTLVPPNLAGGLNATADLTGSGDITSAGLGLIVSLVAALTGSGTVSADIVGALQVSADLTGSGTISCDLGALASMVASLTGTGTISAADMRAIGNISADISPFTELSPTSLAAAVWNAFASEFNAVGTMGEKLNDAGAAGNPWAALLADNVDPDTFGEFVQKLLTTGKFLGLK